MIKRFLEWGNQDNSLGDFIEVAFRTAMITLAMCLSLLIIFELQN